MPIVMMPALSPTMTEGKLAKWLVKEGDSVASGDVIAEIETDKATMEVEALDDGKVASILVREGSEGIAVGTAIAEILGEGEESEVGKETAPAPAPAPQESAPKEVAKPAPVPKAPPKSEQTVPKAPRIFASPLARRIAADKGLDLRQIQGSGPHGRIIKADVESGHTAPASASADGDSTLIPITATRKIIASRLQESMQTAPHFYINMDIALDALLDARKAVNQGQDDGAKITVNDMLIKCAAAALMRIPEVNTSWEVTGEGEAIRQWHHADIAVAVAAESGLVTPIVWQADQKSLTKISAEMRELIAKAQDGKLKLNEFSGGSFTISNLGMFGVSSFTAVINPPHGAILAIGAGREMAVAKNGELTVATMMTATLSCDHRVIDGAVGAKWMAAFKEIVETPMLAFI